MTTRSCLHDHVHTISATAPSVLSHSAYSRHQPLSQ